MSTAVDAPRLVARIVHDDERDPQRSGAKVQRRRRYLPTERTISSLLIVLLLAFLGVSGFGGTTRANAGIDLLPGYDLPNPCLEGSGGRGPDMFRSGPEQMLPMMNPVTGSVVQKAHELSGRGKPLLSGPKTTYEWYGMAGIQWSVFFGSGDDGAGDAFKDVPCFDIPKLTGNFLANMLLTNAKTIMVITIGMYSWASDPNLLGDFLNPLDCIVKGCNGGAGLKGALYLEFLTPMIVLGALYMGWTGLVKKQSTTAAQGAAWMIGSAAFALVFMAYPSAIASTTNSLVSNINSSVMTSVTRSTSAATPANDMCYLPTSEPGYSKRMANCSLYKALVFTPWATGQFGMSPDQPLPASSDAVSECQSKLDNCKVGTRSLTDVREIQLAAQAMSHNDLSRGTSASNHHAVWNKVKDGVKDQPHEAAWRGENTGERISVAIAANVAAIMAGLLIILISFASVVLSLGMLLLMLMAPLFLLVGAHPGFGRGIALKWLEMLIGTAVKRVVLGVFLALLIGIYQIILATPMSWFSQVCMIIAVGVAALMYRKPMLEAFNVINLGGSRSGLEGGRGFDRQGKKGAAMALGSASGGIAAARNGGGLGGFATGLVMGGIMGTRSRSPMRAAMMGAGTGRRAAGRAKAKDAREQREEEKQRKEREQGQNGDGRTPDQDGDVADDPSLDPQSDRQQGDGNGNTPRPDRPNGGPQAGGMQCGVCGCDVDDGEDLRAHMRAMHADRPMGDGFRPPVTTGSGSAGGGGSSAGPRPGGRTPRPGGGGAGGGVPSSPVAARSTGTPTLADRMGHGGDGSAPAPGTAPGTGTGTVPRPSAPGTPGGAPTVAPAPAGTPANSGQAPQGGQQQVDPAAQREREAAQRERDEAKRERQEAAQSRRETDRRLDGIETDVLHTQHDVQRTGQRTGDLVKDLLQQRKQEAERRGIRPTGMGGNGSGGAGARPPRPGGN